MFATLKREITIISQDKINYFLVHQRKQLVICLEYTTNKRISPLLCHFHYFKYTIFMNIAYPFLLRKNIFQFDPFLVVVVVAARGCWLNDIICIINIMIITAWYTVTCASSTISYNSKASSALSWTFPFTITVHGDAGRGV